MAGYIYFCVFCYHLPYLQFRATVVAALYQFDIRVNHQSDQLLKRCFLRIPSEHLAGLCRIAEKLFDFGRTEKARVNLDHRAAPCAVDTSLVDALAFPTQLNAGILEVLAGWLALNVYLAQAAAIAVIMIFFFIVISSLND